MTQIKREFLAIDDLDVAGATVLLRVDVNSPLNPETGSILDDTRMRRHLPTIGALNEARLVILAHQGRPGSKDYAPLEAHARHLSGLLGQHVGYVDGLIGPSVKRAVKALRPGEKLLLENTRFHAEEVAIKKEEAFNNTLLVKNLSALADLYVNDAFAASHRAQPSLVGFVERLPCAAGLLMEHELSNLFKAFEKTEGPSFAVLGGLKVDDSIRVMDHILSENIVSSVLSVGVVANIVLMAQGHQLGKPNISFLEKEVPGYQALVEETKGLLKKHGGKIEAPKDLALNVDGKREHIPVGDLPTEHPIFDIGIESIGYYTHIIEQAEKVILNGPAGVFEIPAFSDGTFEIFRAMARCKGYTVMGGGHTSAVAEKLRVEKRIDHISTGGGALINYLAGKRMPVIEMLKKSKRMYDEGAYEAT